MLTSGSWFLRKCCAQEWRDGDESIFNLNRHATHSALRTQISNYCRFVCVLRGWHSLMTTLDTWFLDTSVVKLAAHCCTGQFLSRTQPIRVRHGECEGLTFQFMALEYEYWRCWTKQHSWDQRRTHFSSHETVRGLRCPTPEPAHLGKPCHELHFCRRSQHSLLVSVRIFLLRFGRSSLKFVKSLISFCRRLLVNLGFRFYSLASVVMLFAFIYNLWVEQIWPEIRVPPKETPDSEGWTPLHPG